MYSVVRQRLAERILPHISALALQQGIMLLGANVLGNLLQYLFHFFASHALGPAEYGIVTTLLGLSMMLSVPAGIAQLVITQYVSGFYAKKEQTRVAALFADAMKGLSLASLAAFGLILVASPFIAAFLNVPSALPVIAMASMFLFMGPFITLIGAFQGLQQFYWVAAQLVVGPGVRLAFGLLLISIGWGASGALGATTISNLFFIGIALFWTRDLWSGKADGHGLTWGSVSRYSGIVFLGTLAFTISTNIDLVIVKHFFPSVEAGYYSAASVLGKIILFIPGAIATLMFPKTSYRYALGQSASDVARKSMLISAGLCGVGAAVLAVFPTLAVHSLFGADYDPSVSLVSLYGLAMGLYALVQLQLAFYISQEEPRFAWLLVAVTGALAIFLMFVHVSLAQVVISLAGSAFLILVIGEFWLDGLGLARHLRSASE